VAEDLGGLVTGRPGGAPAVGAEPATLIERLRLPTALPADLGATGAEEAHRLGRADYLIHAGAGPAAAPASDAGSGSPAGNSGGAAGGLAGGRRPKVFVVAEIKLPPGEDLPAALPEISEATGLIPAENEPVLAAALSKGRATVRGWIEETSLEKLVRHPWVAEVGLEFPVGYTDQGSGGAAVSTYATLRLPADRPPDEALRDAVARMSESAGFVYRRTVGYRVLEGDSSSGASGTAVIVYGSLPAGRLSRLLGLPGVLRLDPTSRWDAPPAPARSAGLAALRRPLWLMLAGSLLLAFPWVGVLVRLLLTLL
jgi:hypothetical protein